MLNIFLVFIFFSLFSSILYSENTKKNHFFLIKNSTPESRLLINKEDKKNIKNNKFPEKEIKEKIKNKNIDEEKKNIKKEKIKNKKKKET